MSFVKHTWQWGDYIPDVWDRWLSDKTGRMFVVEVDGKVVGMNHLRILEEGVGWLEGVRIHPDYRRRGLATLLGEEAMDYARKMGIKRFRLLSSIQNKPAHMQVKKMGFRRIGIFNAFQLAGSVNAKGRTTKSLEDIFDIAKESLLASKEFRVAKGFFFDSWTMRSFEECGVENVLRKFQLSFTRINNELAFALTSHSSGAEKFSQINFLWGSKTALKTLVQSLVNLKKDIETLLPRSFEVTYAMKSAGFKMNNRMILFERIET